MLTDKIKSVLLVDSNSIDNFVNQKLLLKNGVIDILFFNKTENALSHLKETNTRYDLILIDIYPPIIDGFEFINKFNSLCLNKTQGEICVLSASVNPVHIKTAEVNNIRFIEKPLTIKKLLFG